MKRSAVIVILLIVIALFSLGNTSKTDGSSFKKTGIYSSMRYNEEGADVLGAEIFLVYSKDGYFVVFQSSEGEPDVPVVVKADVEGDKIVFTLPDGPGYSGKFSGEISLGGIVGSFKGGDELSLKRTSSYWQ